MLPTYPYLHNLGNLAAQLFPFVHIDNMHVRNMLCHSLLKQHLELLTCPFLSEDICSCIQQIGLCR